MTFPWQPREETGIWTQKKCCVQGGSCHRSLRVRAGAGALRRGWARGLRLAQPSARRPGTGVHIPVSPWFHRGHCKGKAGQILSGGGGGWRFENESEPINLSLTPFVPEYPHCTCVASVFLPRSHTGEAWSCVPTPGPAPGPRLAAASPGLRTAPAPGGDAGSDSTPTLLSECCLRPWREAGPGDMPGDEAGASQAPGGLPGLGRHRVTGARALSGTCCPHAQLSPRGLLF